MSAPDSKRGRKRRVVVTGLGAVAPTGVGAENFWQASLSGRVGTGPVTAFNTDGLLSRNGGEVRNFAVGKYISNQDPATLTRSAQFAVAVTRMALEDAGLLSNLRDRDRIGTVFGTVIGNRPAVEPLIRRLYARPDVPVGEFEAVKGLDGTMLSRASSAEFGINGPNVVIPTACAAGNSAIAYSTELIERNRVDAMVAGGADELSPAMFMMFSSVQALSPDVVRPFDRNRKGILISEGAGALLLESYEHASARGAHIYGQIAGCGNFADAYHMTSPHPKGIGASRSMKAAVEAAGIEPHEVDYISAHGTGTPKNDYVESKAIRDVFEDSADSLPVSSIKSMCGHTQGAATAIEAVTCMLSIRDGMIPPTMNVEEPDPGCNVDLVLGTARRQRVDVALSNGFGFGGNISCVVFSRLGAVGGVT